MCLYHYAFITCGGFSLYIGFDRFFLSDITFFSVHSLYGKRKMSVKRNITINPPYNNE
nr:MAG TPA: hypothetical protein [Caudoviricetes sp.]